MAVPTSEYLVLENFWKICTCLKIFGYYILSKFEESLFEDVWLKILPLLFS